MNFTDLDANLSEFFELDKHHFLVASKDVAYK